jgi:hypothetical protein
MRSPLRVQVYLLKLSLSGYRYTDLQSWGVFCFRHDFAYIPVCCKTQVFVKTARGEVGYAVSDCFLEVL